MSIRVVVLLLTVVGGLRAQDEAAPQPQPALKWATRGELYYPQMARIAHIQGDVWVEIELDPTGNIVALRPSVGHPILIAAATDCLRRSKFICEGCGTENHVFSARFIFKMGDLSAGPGGPLPIIPIRPDPLPVRRTRSAKCLYLWKCSAGNPGGHHETLEASRSQNR